MSCKCDRCKSKLIKWGTYKTRQRYKCTQCNKTEMQQYIYRAYLKSTNKQLVNLLKESVGIRGISRLLRISKTTVLKRIVEIAQNLQPPYILKGKTYEVDEMRTYIGNKKKLFWVVYALERKTRNVVSINVGRRTKNTIKHVINTLVLSYAKKIYTDQLNIYKSLIPKNIHKVKEFGTNYVERKHLNIRTHLKRMDRKTICYSKSLVLLSSCIKIYLWG